MKAKKEFNLKDCINITQEIISKMEKISDGSGNTNRESVRESVFDEVAIDLQNRKEMIDFVVNLKAEISQTELSVFREKDDYLMALLQAEKKKILEESFKLNHNHKAVKSYLKK